jgi:hypothetical protein
MANPTELLKETKLSPPETGVADVTGSDAGERKRWFPAVAWTSLAFAVLQSGCTIMIGLGGARLVISFLSLAAASSVFATARFVHQNAFRVPKIIIAVIGAVLNLIVVAQVRHLRNRPSARWRLDMSSLRKKLRQENWQIALSIITLVVVAIEESIHRVRHHHF